MVWSAINAYTSSHQDDFVLEMVRPWTRRLADEGRLHFVRHWQGGPHVSFRVELPATRFEKLSPALTVEAEQWLSGRGPEPPAVDAGLLHELAQREEHESVESIKPPGSVVAVAALPGREDALGGPAATALYEDYLVDSHEHALHGVALAAEHGRMRVAFDALVTALDGLLGDISKYFLSYRSHADGFLMNTPDPSATRAFFERSYEQRADALRARVGSLMDGADDPSAQWGRAANPRLRAYMRRAEQGLAAGELRPVATGAALETPGTTADDQLRHSSFHRVAHRTGAARRIEESSAWQAYRHSVNYLYADIARIGITGVERFLTCHLVSRAVEDVLGVNATERLAALGGAGSPGADEHLR